MAAIRLLYTEGAGDEAAALRAACNLSGREHALGLKADLLVMGGYGHSRVRDFVLGGATQGVLSELRLPVLISH